MCLFSVLYTDHMLYDPGGPLLPMYVDSMLTVCSYVGSSVFVVCLIQ